MLRNPPLKKKRKKKPRSRNLPTTSMVSHTDTLDPPNQSLTFAFCGILELKKSLVILEKAGKEKDFKTCAPLTK